jgi:hypothetical protein
MTTGRPPRQPILTIPQSRRGKIGCGMALVIWFLLLSLPCAMFWFASGNEIRLAHGNVPESYDHPLLEIGLIMEVANRGMKFKTSEIFSAGDNAVCVQTNLNYLLWYSRESNPATSFCDCYERENPAAAWSNIGTTPGDCQN